MPFCMYSEFSLTYLIFLTLLYHSVEVEVLVGILVGVVGVLHDDDLIVVTLTCSS